MEFKAVRGTRDFYPEQMRLRNWITDAWRTVSLRHGFEEYDSPIFEHLDLFTAKSGDEIAEQLFSLTDRGGRSLAIRPETTPALARMVNARISSLPRPIKWFSIGRCCRAERPQKGRTREFFQWNVDVVGSDDVLADAECVFVCVDFLREVGLKHDDIRIRYSSRELLIEVLKNFGVPESDMDRVMGVLDKRPKIPPEEFDRAFAEVVPDSLGRMGILRFLNMPEIHAGPAESIAQNIGMKTTQTVVQAIDKLQRFERHLLDFGIADWCEYDTGIVRGLAYYTGVVYEAFGAGEFLRAVAGGGRYDDLLEVLGGPRLGATGFGMSDVTLGILLEEKGKLPELPRSVDFFVIDAQDAVREKLLRVVGALRESGCQTDFSYTRRSLTKQLKEANKRGARRAVIVRADGLAIKDLASGKQTDVPLDDFLTDPRRYVK